MGLVIGRRKGQSLTIGKDITITMGDTNNEGVTRICIEAPADVPILRDDAIITEPRPARCGTCARLRRQPDEAPAAQTPKPTARPHVRVSGR